jgi:hypothetical protein
MCVKDTGYDIQILGLGVNQIIMYIIFPSSQNIIRGLLIRQAICTCEYLNLPPERFFFNKERQP